ncbi:uncharacterized protein LOC143421508 [Maylandia zebra]|uniref:uncharacterized protein LOC143421508 n=1 Tax=Maylandia zebra TaxID=106582 RepID=UPI00403C871E
MPIASGAAGRVDVGIDTSKTWTPQGLKRKTNSTHRKNDSYLQRYQELKAQQRKGDSLQSTQDKSEPSDHKNDGSKEEVPEKNGSHEDEISEKPSSEKPSKKSVLCVIL